MNNCAGDFTRAIYIKLQSSKDSSQSVYYYRGWLDDDDYNDNNILSSPYNSQLPEYGNPTHKKYIA